jgi:glycosyltransferase involved in cell wall biosynthesis
MPPHSSSPASRLTVALCIEYPLELQGGVSVVCRALGEELGQRFSVILVSPDATSSVPWVREHIRWNPEAVSRQNSRILADELQNRGVDVAFFHFGGSFGWGSRVAGQSPLGYAARRGIRVYSAVHSVSTTFEGYCDPAKPLWFKVALFPFAWIAKLVLLSCVEKEIAVSKHDAIALRRRFWPFAAKFIQIYHSRLSAEVPTASPIAREPLVLNVGHIAHRKGQFTLVRAFARISEAHPQWKLVLVGHFGEPDLKSKLRAYVAERGLTERIVFADSQPDPNVWFRRASIYVQPSREEALGLALQEAMFHGCACIGTRVGGIPELLEEGTGILVPPDDEVATAALISELIMNADRRSALGRSAAHSIRDRGMTRDAMTREYVKLCECHA